MKSIYLESGISKQAHAQMVSRLEKMVQKIPFYEGLILQTREMHPGMGLRTIYEKHQPEGIGRDRFIQLGINLGLCVNPVRSKAKTTFTHKGSRFKNLLVSLELTDVNQVWATDITYFMIGLETYYISLLMDLYSRRILGYYASRDLRAQSSVRALQLALDNRGIDDYHEGLIHHSDRGSQYVSDIYTETLNLHGIRISMCSNVYENTMQERVNRTIKNQYLKNWQISKYDELARKLEDAVYAYNYDKPHAALNKMSPVEYEQNLNSIPTNKRDKVSIFTFDRSKYFDPNQMQLSF